MNDVLSRETFRQLSQVTADPCVTILLPTHRKTAAVEQGRIRLKNMLRDAEERLTERGLRGPEARELLAPAQQLVDDAMFWQYQSDGLALLLTREQMWKYRVPMTLPEVVHVNRRFYLKPLFPLLFGQQAFFVLALSQKNVQLFEGSQEAFEPVLLEGLSETLSDVAPAEGEVQFHTRAPVRGGERAAMYYGSGGDSTKDTLLRLFREIDRKVTQAVRGRPFPLLLAAVEYYVPLYRDINTYPQLVQEAITGSPEGWTPQQLHERARQVLERLQMSQQEEAARIYQESLGLGRSSDDVGELLLAAHDGRISHLFVNRSAQVWGTFDPERREMEVLDRPNGQADDLLDLVAVATFNHGGQVYAVEGPEVPSQTVAAGVLRY